MRTLASLDFRQPPSISPRSKSGMKNRLDTFRLLVFMELAIYRLLGTSQD